MKNVVFRWFLCLGGLYSGIILGCLFASGLFICDCLFYVVYLYSGSLCSGGYVFRMLFVLM